MASGGDTSAPAEDEGGVPLDIDDVHLLLQGQSSLLISFFGYFFIYFIFIFIWTNKGLN